MEGQPGPDSRLVGEGYLVQKGVLAPVFTNGESAKVGKLRKEQSHG